MKTLTLLSFLAGLVMIGCGGEGDPSLSLEDELSHPNVCAHVKATIKDNNGDHKFVGTDGDDVIIGTPGKDEIYGNGGDDIICGLDGNDYIDGGGGKDWIDAGDGDDVVHGRGGSDIIYGGPGSDLLFGDILDDHVYGEQGADVLIGGHGNDLLHGGPGNDWLRGDTGTDTFIGGSETDVLSFATATPVGQKLDMLPAVPGVNVDFTNPCIQDDDPKKQKHDGCASGDGWREPIDGVEQVIGSPYDDHLISNGGHTLVGDYGNDVIEKGGNDQAPDGPGDDTCNGSPCGVTGDQGPSDKIYVFVQPRKRDLGVVIRGTNNGEGMNIKGFQNAVEITSPAPMLAGEGCTQNGKTVRCEGAMQFVAGYLGDGDDTAQFSGTFPRDFEATIDGGKGSDNFMGSDEADIFLSGIDGEDVMYGMGGDDALLSESEGFGKGNKPMGSAYGGGADKLFGGEGDDQLVADYPCGHHEFHGGPGLDIAGFARSGDYDIKAQLGGPVSDANEKRPFHGVAFNPALCPDFGKWGTTMTADLEILEGADGNDELWGDDTNNMIWGRGGHDELYGLGGNDWLVGADGNDKLYGGAGNDTFIGGNGFDHIFMKDGEKDVYACGGQGVIETRDDNDPSCK